jgi:hypothetical protein
VSYLTVSQVLGASHGRYSARSMAEGILRKSAQLPMTARFDVFLSHAFEDAEIIAGVAGLLEDDGLTVYIDWKIDADVDRSKITAANARLLRQRMDHCQTLLYASTSAAPNSKWMPWELGYFDGKSSGKVGILPILQSVASTFIGQEYLGLYPRYEFLTFRDFPERIGRMTGENEGQSLKDLARAS